MNAHVTLSNHSQLLRVLLQIQTSIALLHLNNIVHASQQCNLGLKLFSIESGNAVCAPFVPFQCIELCEWVEADKGGCSLSSHYTAFRARRTYLAGMVLTEASFLIQCCASLASSVLLDAEQEPICRWSEQIETVVEKPTVRFHKPLNEHEYLRDLRGIRVGRGAAKIQTEICKFVVQRTNCDRKLMSPEEVRQYSLLLLRLQRTHDFFKNAQGGIVNAGSSNNPVGNEIHERARAEHRIIYKNTTKIEQLGFIEKETTGKEIVQKAEKEKILVDRVSNAEEKNERTAADRLETESPSTTSTTTPNDAPPEPILYNVPRKRIHQLRNSSNNGTQKQKPKLKEPIPLPTQPILEDEGEIGGMPSEESTRDVRELLYRAAKQGSAILKKLNAKKNYNSSSPLTPSSPIRPLPIRRLRPIGRNRQQKEVPVRMQMSRMGWPKGLRRRLWPVLATNSTQELIPTRTDLNWVDNEFFDHAPVGHRSDISGTIRVIEDDQQQEFVRHKVRMDRIGQNENPENIGVPIRRELRIKKLRKNVVSNSQSGENEFDESDRLTLRRKQIEQFSSGAGGSFAQINTDEISRPKPFQPIKEIETSPLGKAPNFRFVPVEKKSAHAQPFVKKFPRREGHVHVPAENEQHQQHGSQLNKLLGCCQQQAPGCRKLCTRNISQEQIKQAMSSGQCPPLSMTSVLQCFPRFYNISSVSQCCSLAASSGRHPNSAEIFPAPPTKPLPPQCLSLCNPNFHLSFAHLACVEHSERILNCYRQLLEHIENEGMEGDRHSTADHENFAPLPFFAT